MYYTLKRGYIDLHLTQEDINLIEENGILTIGSGKANFDDGSVMEIALGHFEIYNNEYWEDHRLRDGGGGSNDHFDVDFESKIPIQITSIDLSSFDVHRDAIDMEIIVDSGKVYSYEKEGQAYDTWIYYCF